MNSLGEAVAATANEEARLPQAPHVRLGGSRKLSAARGQAIAAAASQAAPLDNVLKSFNSWAFKREQPDSPDLLRRRVAAAAAREQPIPFVLYWGRGPRTAMAEPEILCFQYLEAMNERIKGAYAPGAAFTLICTDTHAQLNGYDAASTDGYFETVCATARARGFATRSLSQIVESTRERLDQAQADAAPPPHVLNALIASAEKHYHGGGAAEHGAVRYFRNNMLEKQAVEHAFPEAIFITFNGSELRPLFPDGMPVFFMYSLRRGVGVKPWFMSAEGCRSPGAPEFA
jgi:hypothetical protein